MDEALKTRLRASGFSQWVDGETNDLIKAMLAECESARSRAEMRGKESESMRIAMKSVQSDLWVQREMFGQMQQQWVAALRKVHQLVSESENSSQAATQSMMR